MNNMIIVYKSKYGSTRKYAQWIAEETGADLFESLEIGPNKLIEYDTIIFGGGLYAGGIAGISNGKKVDFTDKNTIKLLLTFLEG